MSTPGEILQANDDLSSAINSYKKIVEGQSVSEDPGVAQGTQMPVTQGKACIDKYSYCGVDLTTQSTWDALTADFASDFHQQCCKALTSSDFLLEVLRLVQVAEMEENVIHLHAAKSKAFIV